MPRLRPLVLASICALVTLATSAFAQVCTPGTASPTGSQPCTTCGPGTFQPFYAQTSCITCPGGTYSGGGATSCSNCSPGFYSTPGSAFCSQCPAGSFSGAGSGSCSTCPAGKFSAAGSASCSTCPAGTFSGAGAAGCTTCPDGYISSSPGSGSCSQCPAGYTSNANHTACIQNAAGVGPEPPVQAYLAAPAPNPARSAIDIEFGLPATERASVRIHDVVGRLVATLSSDVQTAGIHHQRWNLRADNGQRVRPGVYLVRVHAGDFRATRTLLVVE